MKDDLKRELSVEIKQQIKEVEETLSKKIEDTEERLSKRIETIEMTLPDRSESVEQNLTQRVDALDDLVVALRVLAAKVRLQVYLTCHYANAEFQRHTMLG